MRRKPYVSQKRFYLAGRRKQKGGFFFLALPLAISLGKKLLGGKKKEKKKKSNMVNRRNNIILVKRDTPKKVTLPNGRTFYANYRRVNRNYLPGNVKIQRIFKGRPTVPIGQGPFKGKKKLENSQPG